MPASSRMLWLWIGGAVTLLAVAVATFTRLNQPATASPARAVVGNAREQHPHGPPWVYGRAGAQLTIIEYGDLQCEYCRAYFPFLRRWIDENPQVKWQWHHLPLSIHEPAATQAARLAECVGATAGNGAFWDALAWIYANPVALGELRGPPPDFPAPSGDLTACMQSQIPDQAIRAQAQAATRDGVSATPTLRLIDNASGRTMVLSGPVEGDLLLSAFDLLLAPAQEASASTDAPSKLPQARRLTSK